MVSALLFGSHVIIRAFVRLREAAETSSVRLLPKFGSSMSASRESP
jgi:hypothetical protein